MTFIHLLGSNRKHLKPYIGSQTHLHTQIKILERNSIEKTYVKSLWMSEWWLQLLWKPSWSLSQLKSLEYLQYTCMSVMNGEFTWQKLQTLIVAVIFFGKSVRHESLNLASVSNLAGQHKCFYPRDSTPIHCWCICVNKK